MQLFTLIDEYAEEHVVVKLSMHEVATAVKEYLERRGLNVEPGDAQGNNVFFHHMCNTPNVDNAYTVQVKVQVPEPKDGPYR